MVSYKNCRYSVKIVFPISWLIWNVSISSLPSNSQYIKRTKIMASGPISSQQIDGETVERVSDFISLGSKITAYGDCSH